MAVPNQHSYHRGELIRGFSIIELMVTLAIISLLALVAAPSFVKNFQARNLVAATEDLYSYLQQARIESLSRSKPIYLNLSGLGTTEWAYGLNVESTCNPEIESNQEPSACVLMVDNGDDNFNAVDDNVLSRMDAKQYREISLSGSTAVVTFDPVRGTVSENLIITFSNVEQQSTKITLSRIGNISICSDQLADYQECKG